MQHRQPCLESRSAPARWILLSALLAAPLEGCGNSDIPSYDPSRSAAQALKLYDTNGDGALEGPELKPCPSLQVALPKIDLDGNGKLTKEELATRITSYKNQELSAITLEALILSNGQPVPNAVVTLAPEEFLKESLKPARGTANQTGRAFLATDGISAGGVQLGLYRVQVSLPGAAGEETIPAKFNAETTVGIEVSTDAPGIERGIVLDLKRQ